MKWLRAMFSRCLVDCREMDVTKRLSDAVVADARITAQRLRAHEERNHLAERMRAALTGEAGL